MKSARPWRYSSAITIDESSYVPANADRQHFTVVPESAYYSMQLRCDGCGEEFWFSADEQRTWYEEWGFWIDSVPDQCPKAGNCDVSGKAAPNTTMQLTAMSQKLRLCLDRLPGLWLQLISRR
jgi:hypothetical protein